MPRGNILSYEDIYRLAKVAVQCGIDKLRLTGGEPLVRRQIVRLVDMLARIDGLDDLGLTTNGTLLAAMAHDLYRAGLRRINISLDTLDGARYRWITRGAELARVRSGIDKALEVGFSPVKLNVVVIRGFNDDELLSFSRLALELPLQVRFIEFMPFNNGHFWGRGRYISSREMRDRINSHEELVPGCGMSEAGIATGYRLAGGLGTVSFISPLSASFCSSCNRLRLTADGYLRSCLFSPQELDIKSKLSQGVSDDELILSFKLAAARKPKGHGLECCTDRNTGRAMHAVGG
jgi:cyclic pyranopterin phosphate synthase